MTTLGAVGHESLLTIHVLVFSRRTFTDTRFCATCGAVWRSSNAVHLWSGKI